MSKLVQNLTFRRHTGGVNAAELGALIEQAYLDKNRDRFLTKKTFSPSQVGYGNGRCPRYWYFAFSGVQFVEDNDAVSIANMSHGTEAHKRIEKLFKDTGILLDSEIELKIEDPPVRGFIDLKIDWNGEPVLGEFKTTRSEAWLNRQTSMKPVGYHLIQLLLYMYGTDIKHGFFIYENKNTLELLIIPVEMNEKNQKIIDEVIEWMRSTYKAFEDKKIPARPFRKNSKECKGCPLFRPCWDGPKGEIDLDPLPII